MLEELQICGADAGSACPGSARKLWLEKLEGWAEPSGQIAARSLASHTRAVTRGQTGGQQHAWRRRREAARHPGPGRAPTAGTRRSRQTQNSLPEDQWPRASETKKERVTAGPLETGVIRRSVVDED